MACEKVQAKLRLCLNKSSIKKPNECFWPEHMTQVCLKGAADCERAQHLFCENECGINFQSDRGQRCVRRHKNGTVDICSRPSMLRATGLGFETAEGEGLRHVEERHSACSKVRPFNMLLRGRQSTRRRCGLLLHLHVPKTGGITIRSMFKSLPHWQDWAHYCEGHLKLFRAFPEIFPSSVKPPCSQRRWSASAGNSSDANGELNWRSKQILVEFHDEPGRENFFKYVLPRLGDLRAAYAKEGCPCVLTTVLRAPRTSLLSNFQYFYVFGLGGRTPKPTWNTHEIRTNKTAQLQAFTSHLERVQEPQLWWLSGNPHGPTHEDVLPREGQPPCDRDWQAAMQLLQQTDMVGVTEHLREYAWRLMAGAPATRLLECNNNKHPNILANVEFPQETRVALGRRVHCSDSLYQWALNRDQAERRDTLALVHKEARANGAAAGDEAAIPSHLVAAALRQETLGEATTVPFGSSAGPLGPLRLTCK
jgi:hypothetical protein